MRIVAGWTQAELAEKLGWAEERVITIERAEYQNASFSELLAVAGALEIEAAFELAIGNT